MLCGMAEDNQRHIAECSVILHHFSSTDVTANNNIKYEDIFEDPKKQKSVTHFYKQLLSVRERLMESNPSTSDVVLLSSFDVHCIDNSSSGK